MIHFLVSLYNGNTAHPVTQSILIFTLNVNNGIRFPFSMEVASKKLRRWIGPTICCNTDVVSFYKVNAYIKISNCSVYTLSYTNDGHKINIFSVF